MTRGVLQKSIILGLTAALLASLLVFNAGTPALAQDGGNVKRPGVSPDYRGLLPELTADDLWVNTNGRTRIIVEMSQPPTALAAQLQVGAASIDAVATSMGEAIEAEQAFATNFMARLPGNVQVLDTLRAAVNAIVVEVDAANVNALRQIPGVKNLYPDSIVERANADAAQRIAAPPVWQSGLTGAGVRVGVIDDGLDYRHAHFGGNLSATWGSFTGLLAAKVVGGYDFVGDLYDARNPLSVPTPDPDPLTCWPSPGYPTGFGGETAPIHHGTHVAGSLAGYGVASDGSTYAGPYDTTTPLATMLIGPGIAPLAQLYIYRVFGCYGSTATVNVVAAIDRSVDPDQNGSPADRLDVINMSLGSGFGSGLGIYEVAINNATAAGVVVVASAGNGSDSFFVTGSPAAASAAISVANTSMFTPLLTINTPVSQAHAGFGASFGPPITTPITGNIVEAVPVLACGTGPLTNASAIAGNIALIDRGGCPFVDKVRRAQASGAIAAIICSVTGPAGPMGGSDPSITIPSIQLEGASCAAFRTLSPLNGTISLNTQDGLNTSSSRGPRRATNISPLVLKPDVAAPGTNILSSVGPTLPGPLYNRSARYSGTSMAAPMVAGMAAVLRQLRPTWSPAEIKANIMNTASANVFVQPGITPDLFGIGRVGSGRADLQAAVSTSVIAYDSAAPERVSVSFGLLEVVGSGTFSRTITVRNLGAAPASYNVSVQNVVNQNGTTVTASPSNIVVPVAGTATVTVTISANPVTNGSLNRDPSTPTLQAGVRREWLPEVNGNILLTPSSGPVLRVPYHAVVRPVSEMKATTSHIELTSTTGTFNIAQSGTTFSTGPLSGPGLEFNAESIVSPFRLLYQSPNEANVFSPTENHADIRYVGVTSDYGARSGNLNLTQIYFAIVPWSNVTTPKEVEYAIYIDVNRDDVDDYVLFNPRFSSGGVQVDFYGTSLAVEGGIGTAPVGIQDFINPVEFADPLGPVQTYKFLNNVYVLGVSAGGAGTSPFGGGGLKLTPGPFNFRVEAFSYEHFEVIDVTPTLTYDPTADIFDFTGASAGGPFVGVPWYFARPSDSIPVDYNLANYVPGSGPARILLLYYHNRSGFGRTQVIGVSGPGLPNPLVGDTIGTRRSSNQTFYLRTSLTSGPANYLGILGTSSEIAFAGDWDGDGTDTPGVYDPATGLVTLSNNIDGSPPHIVFYFGVGGDYPIAGDWNGDGIDSLGVYRQSTGRLLLRNDNSTGFADFDMIFGIAGDVPFAGDWTGNGADAPGIFRPSLNTFFLLYNVGSGVFFADEVIPFGSSTDQPVAGDWDGNGITDIGVYRPSMGMFSLRMPDTSATGGGHFMLAVPYGIPGDYGLAGRWFPPQPLPPSAPEVAPTFVPRQ
ncbi:MAG: S8 family serine peptidase [Aggregatilineales bacterium]